MSFIHEMLMRQVNLDYFFCLHYRIFDDTVPTVFFSIADSIYGWLVFCEPKTPEGIEIRYPDQNEKMLF